MKDIFGFIGLGLIGGSIAKALKNHSEGCRIIAFSHTTQPTDDLKNAINSSVADELVFSLSALSCCQVVFLCAPIDVNISYLSKLSSVLSKDTLITDVGSVKQGIHLAAKEAGVSAQFIGGHPMTGSERNGFLSSNSLLMENAYYAVTAPENFEQKKLDLLLSLIEEMKSIPLLLSPERHDEAVSAISHLPHILAAELCNMAAESKDSKVLSLLAAGGFKDITRIASSSPELWTGILMANRIKLLTGLSDFSERLWQVRTFLEEKDTDSIYSFFQKAGTYRNSIESRKGLLNETFLLYADIKDETGAIASFAALLANAGISIKNIGIVHNREFERGALRIEFYDKETKQSAFSLLCSHGCSVYPD